MIFKYKSIKRVSELSFETLFSLKNLDKKYFPQPWDDASWDKLFSTSAERLVVALYNDTDLIGFSLFEHSHADSFAHLLKIIIDPNERKKGLGEGLLMESLKVLKDEQIKTIFLEVAEDNANAIKLYQKNGFTMIHKKKHFYSNGATALIMTLEV